MRFLIFMVLMGTVCGLKAQNADLSGQLIDEQATAVSGARVVLTASGASTRTDSEGRFTFSDVALGSVDLDVEISRQQHHNVTLLHNGEPVLIDLGQLSLDTLVVSANPLEHSPLKMTTPAAIIDESELLLSRGLNISETLSANTGVNMASFGTGAGQPVIRGQQGNRVTVLNNNASLQDAANVSPDHWVSVEPLLARHVEILKGPATLLYGGQAVGGAVNVVDNKVPIERADEIHGGVEARLSDSTLSERALVGTLDVPLNDRWMAHADFFTSQSDDYEIPGFAESAQLRAQEEAEHDDGDDDDEHEEEHAQGLVENTDVDSQGYSLGIARHHENGYWGFAWSGYDRNYGIPGHSHGEEEHDDGDDDEHEEHEEEAVRIDLDKKVFDFKVLQRFSDNWLKQFKLGFSRSDYQHAEIEGDEVGTVFDNDASEWRLEFTHATLAGWSGAFGLQLKDREFSALGEEAFILPSDTRSLGVFLIEEWDWRNFHTEVGLRHDSQRIDTALFGEVDDEAWSFSLGETWAINERWTLPINFAYAQRLPTAEELFSNQSGADELIPHLATALIEVGNRNLKAETAKNIDIGVRFRGERMEFNLAWYRNRIDDFIFLNPTDEFVDEFQVFNYDQQDATFKGYEFDLSYRMEDAFANQWIFKLLADATEATLENGQAVPRIPADRLGFHVNFIRGPYSANVKYTRASAQRDVAQFELPTDGYNLLNVDLSRVFYSNRLETTVFVRAQNLLDEEIRDHASFIKDLAPRPGRSLSMGVRVNF